MADKKLSDKYRKIEEDVFPEYMEISFFRGSPEDSEKGRQTLRYEKVQWDIAGEKKGLRYGENPGQKAALYRMESGNLALGDVSMIGPGNSLVSSAELIQTGKHPGKINLTDIDAGLNILRMLGSMDAAVILKHNNPSGAAKGESISDALLKAFYADPVAAFGGTAALNRPVDRQTAEMIGANYFEVVAAPDFEESALEILRKRKNLRIFRIGRMDKLEQYAGSRFLELKSLIDGGVIAQVSYVPEVTSPEHFIIPEAESGGKKIRIRREPTEAEIGDMLFGWMVETGVTSNSVLYVKDGVTLGIGAGEQDRVGVAKIARDKALRSFAETAALKKYGQFTSFLDAEKQAEMESESRKARGGLSGSIMVSDAFFPFRDGVEVGLKEGVSGIIQPGGSINDYQVIEACNEYGASMVFTGERSFKH